MPSQNSLQVSLVEAILKLTFEDPKKTQPNPHTAPGNVKERRDTIPFVFENDLLDTESRSDIVAL